MSESLHVEAATTAVAPGSSVPLPVRVLNTSDSPMSILVRIVGVEDDWVGPPTLVGPLAPGEEAVVDFAVRIPVGFPPCDHLAGIEAEPIDPVSGAPIGRPVHTEVVLEIGDGTQVRATLEPADLRGGARGKFRVSLRNRGRHPLSVKLAAESPGDALRVRFDEDEVVLPPGEFVKVRAKVKGARPLLGPDRRLPFVVTLRSRGTPRHLDGSFTQTATLKSGVLKVLAIFAVIAMWAAVLVFGLGRINPPKKAVTAPAGATESSAASDAQNGGGGGGSGGGGGGGGSGGGGSQSGDGSTAGQAPTGTSEIRVGGKLKGNDPGGATITIQPTSLVDENAQGATFVNGSPSNALTKHYGHTGISAPSLVGAAKSTTTDSDGTWAFGGIKAPGIYLIVISKPGYMTQKFVIQAGDDGKPIVQDADLIAGDGGLSGTVFGPDGPLGGVDLTITDGTITLKTITPTTGDVGKWSITGLTTPGSYLITASRSGFGDETKLVDLSAGGSDSGADITMHAGVGSIRGTVTSASGPVGDVTVSVTDGTTSQSVTTLTVDPKGTYNIPQLPIPGQYTMTIEAAGWITQTQLVDLVDNKVVDVSLTPSGGTLTGVVTGCLPRTTPSDPCVTGELAGVGVTISNEKITLKTTSATGGGSSAGLYVQNDIPPGTYNVTFEKAGTIPQSSVVDIGAGDIKTIDMVMPDAPPVTDELSSKVSITVRSQKDLSLLSPTVSPAFNVAVTYDEIPDPTLPGTLAVTKSPTSGVASFDHVTPGVVTFTATADHFKTSAITVTVPPGVNEIPVNATIVMPQNAIVQGLVTDIHGAAITTGDIEVTASPLGRGTTHSAVTVTADTDGRYIFDGTLDEGTWSLSASGGDFVASAPQVITVFAGQTIEQNFTLQQLGQMTVNVLSLDADGNTFRVDGSKVQLTSGPTNPLPAAQVINGGAVTFTALTDGAHTVTVTLPNGQQTTASSTAVKDTTQFVNLVAGRLEVSVQSPDAAGQPTPAGGIPVSIVCTSCPPSQPSDATRLTPSMSSTVPEVQQLTVNATGGTFALSFQGSAFTPPLAFNADASAIQSALVALPTIGSGNVAVTGTGPFTITFGGAYANADVPTIVASSASLTGGSHSAAVATTTEGGKNAAGVAAFSRLAPGNYTVTVGTGGATQTLSTTIPNLLTTTRIGTAVVSPPASNLTGTVSWSKNGVTTNIPNATVSANGVTAYTFVTSPNPPFFSFVVTRGSISTNTDALGAYTLQTSANFKFTTGDLTVTATGYVTNNSNTNISLASPPNRNVTMQPQPSTLGGLVTLSNTGTADPVQNVLAQVTSPTGTGVGVTVDSGGSIHILDSRVQGTNAIRPGDYTFQFSLAGYDTVSQSVVCDPVTGCSPSALAVTLVKRGSLPITVQCSVNGGTAVTPSTARVHVHRDAVGGVAAFDQTLIGAQPLTFTNLLTTSGTAVNYVIDAQAAGCAGNATAASLTLQPGETSPRTVNLTKYATITGRVVSRIADDGTSAVSGVGGITVTLTGTNRSPTTGNTTAFTTTTDDGGNFTFTGILANNTTGVGDHEGLKDDLYHLTIDSTGYTLATLPAGNSPIPDVDITGGVRVVPMGGGGSASAVPDIILISSPASITVTVTDGTDPLHPVIQGVSVTATATLLNRTVTATTDVHGQFTFTDLEPTQWSFNYTVPNYAPFGETITFNSGANLIHSVPLVQRRNTIQGTTFTKYGSATHAAEDGVTVTVTNLDDTALDPAKTATSALNGAAHGKYTIGGLLNGSYFATFHKDGFTDQKVQFTVNDGQTLVLDGEIAAEAVAVDVTVHSAVTNHGFQGVTVTVTPNVGQRATVTQFASAPLADGVVSFAQLLPSTYTITLSDTNGHLTTIDDDQLDVPVNGPAVHKLVTIQEAQLRGRVLVQDTNAAAVGQSGLTVNLFIGTSATPAANPQPQTGTGGLWSIFLGPSNTGYTAEFEKDSDHKSFSIQTTIGRTHSIAVGDDYDYGDIKLEKFADITVTVNDPSVVDDATVTLVSVSGPTETQVAVLNASNNTGNTYKFDLLDPDKVYKVYGTRSVTTPSSGSSSGGTTTHDDHTGNINLDPGEHDAETLNLH
jgi:hypothetical protein